MKRKIFSILFALVLVLTLSLVTAVPASAATLNVPSASYPTIQSAVNAANPAGGDTIIVTAGTYDEQVVINKSLTLQGAGDTTIIQPSGTSTLTSLYTLGTQTGAWWNGHKLASIIEVSGVGTAGVTIKDLKVNGANVNSTPAGANYIVGISYGETAGTIDDVTVVNMDTTSENPRTYGMWLDAVGDTALLVEVKNSIVTRYNKNGINARGNDLTVNLHHNTVQGPGGSGVQVPNGICLVQGVGGTINNNTIYDDEWAGGTWKSGGVVLFGPADGVSIQGNEIYNVDTGLLISNAYGSGTEGNALIQDNSFHDSWAGVLLECGTPDNTITGNYFYDNDHGIVLNGPLLQGAGTEPGAGNTAHYNNITGNTAGFTSYDNTQTFDTKYNWWGDCSGPYHPSTNPTATGDTVSDYVDYDPWLGQQLCLLKAAITALPDSAFTKPNAATDQRQALLDKIDAVCDDQYDDGAYRGAKNKLERDIKRAIQRWIDDSAPLITMVDVEIGILDGFLQ